MLSTAYVLNIYLHGGEAAGQKKKEEPKVGTLREPGLFLFFFLNKIK